MTERLNINKIDMSIEEWTSKVQVVDKGHPRTNREGNKKYQLMILQDEEETQIQVTMYGTDITHYENEFVPFQTYLLSGAFVTKSTKAYGNPLHQFTWTIDKGTIVEPIEQVIPPEPPLLPPTLIKVTSFDSFDYQVVGFEFGTSQNIFTLILTNNSLLYARYSCPRENGSPPSYASNGSRIQEFIIIDYQSDEIKPLLSTYTTKSTTAIGPLLFVPFEEHIVPIVNIQQQSLSAPTASKSFQGIGHSEDSIVQPVVDQYISHPAMISDKIGEELLSLTVAEIRDVRCIKKQLLPLILVQHILLGNTFTIQIKKLFAKNKDASSAKLFIMSITEKDIASNLPLHQQLQKAVNAS
ncbi:uncharacterized protein LOC125858882 [Solanum stenotomum]|uniref:uncharacterized protein LOC125858882 n=1 Tax=Solanum stenotomum TaxID=172797 RepID=UPI0020D0E530|nr:uncharacterized protein LOC125858882 [Solanum stenotomum]